MTVWMEITKDKYELPVAVADTGVELARMRGLSGANFVSHAMSLAKKNGSKCKYIKVEIDDD